jgi:hypothetical protein
MDVHKQKGLQGTHGFPESKSDHKKEELHARQEPNGNNTN